MIDLDRIDVSAPSGGAPPRAILRNITLTIDDGEWIAVVGPNGAGKTTLLKTVSGLLRPSAGTIRRDSQDTLRKNTGRAFGVLLQEPDNQLLAASVLGELRLSVPPWTSAEAGRECIEETAVRFGLEVLLGRNPHKLSGGEKQRLALATVWMSRPATLLLDEPTSYLDSDERGRCLEFVRELHAGGASVIWVSPDAEALKAADRVVALDAGEVCFDGPVGAFVARDPLHHADGAPPATNEGRKPVCGGESVVSFRDVSFSYGETPALHGISMGVASGECVGIGGRNGSGKSTLLSLMSGVLEPTAGVIERAFRRPVARRRQNVFHLFQSPERLFFAETVFEEVAFGLRALGLAEAAIADRVAGALARVGLDPAEFSGRLPFTLSFGEMRRLALAIALALEPAFLVLDEPASCLDRTGRRILLSVIADTLDRGGAVALASHDLAAVGPVLTRRYVLP